MTKVFSSNFYSFIKILMKKNEKLIKSSVLRSPLVKFTIARFGASNNFFRTTVLGQKIIKKGAIGCGFLRVRPRSGRGWPVSGFSPSTRNAIHLDTYRHAIRFPLRNSTLFVYRSALVSFPLPLSLYIYLSISLSIFL